MYRLVSWVTIYCANISVLGSLNLVSGVGNELTSSLVNTKLNRILDSADIQHPSQFPIKSLSSPMSFGLRIPSLISYPYYPIFATSLYFPDVFLRCCIHLQRPSPQPKVRLVYVLHLLPCLSL